jgi:hypothetical protein
MITSSRSTIFWNLEARCRWKVCGAQAWVWGEFHDGFGVVWGAWTHWSRSSRSLGDIALKEQRTAHYWRRNYENACLLWGYSEGGEEDFVSPNFTNCHVIFMDHLYCWTWKIMSHYVFVCICILTRSLSFISLVVPFCTNPSPPNKLLWFWFHQFSWWSMPRICRPT